MLFIGVFLGQSSTPESNLIKLLGSVQSLVNTILVPCYSLCVFLYILHHIPLPFDTLISKQSSIGNQQQQQPFEQQQQGGLVSDGDDDDHDGCVSMTGTFKLIENKGFEDLLEAQGVPWALRRAANSARPTHKLSHRGNTLLIQIKGIIESQTTYEIGGASVDIDIRGRKFRDTASYLPSKDGIQVIKVCAAEKYKVQVVRRLSPCQKTITMTSNAIFEDEERETVESVQIFERQQ